MRNTELENKIIEGLNKGYWGNKEAARTFKSQLIFKNIDWYWLDRFVVCNWMEGRRRAYRHILTSIILLILLLQLTLKSIMPTVYLLVAVILCSCCLLFRIIAACLYLRSVFPVDGRFSYFTNWQVVMLHYVQVDILGIGGDSNAYN